MKMYYLLCNVICIRGDRVVYRFVLFELFFYICRCIWYLVLFEYFMVWMVERLFSFIKNLSSCEDIVGENWELRFEKRGIGE